GPCIAKKGETADAAGGRDIDAALTFRELRDWWAARGLDPATAPPAAFDPPRGGLGGLFAVSRGLLQAAAIDEDLTTGEVVTAAGRAEFVEAVREFGSGDLSARLLEVLCCQGCLSGAGMTEQAPLFRRRTRVGEYVRRRQREFDRAAWQADLAADAALPLDRSFTPADQRLAAPDAAALTATLRQMGQRGPEDELNCGACGYDTCREHAAAIVRGLAEHEMCLPHTIEQLRATVHELASTQEALVQSEKLAGLGQLAAGIAHEVNNPLGVVLMYAHLLRDACAPGSEQYADLDLIARQADRCKKIVAGLLHFARQNQVASAPVDLHGLVREVLALQPAPAGVTVTTALTLTDPVIIGDGDQLLQVLTNLVTNAYAALAGRGELTVRTAADGDRVTLSVTDTGSGIAREHRARLFEPFFTTKPAGQGTGLGLAVSYGIVKMHRGDIRVVSNDDPAAGPTGSSFTLVLPRAAAPRE
ncbi:MAG TPA: ATP-binding protein, partial [bacterium]|nr:ATP-binding protein [bacterium]